MKKNNNFLWYFLLISVIFICLVIPLSILFFLISTEEKIEKNIKDYELNKKNNKLVKNKLEKKDKEFLSKKEIDKYKKVLKINLKNDKKVKINFENYENNNLIKKDNFIKKVAPEITFETHANVKKDIKKCFDCHYMFSSNPPCKYTENNENCFDCHNFEKK